MKQPLVQILVVVANIQMRTLETEKEKVSMGTVVGHGLEIGELCFKVPNHRPFIERKLD